MRNLFDLEVDARLAEIDYRTAKIAAARRARTHGRRSLRNQATRTDRSAR